MKEKKKDAPRSMSACLAVFFENAYVRMISGNVVALKYCLLGCSFVPCSFEYCSIGLNLNERPPLYGSGLALKNSGTCLPCSRRWLGGMLQAKGRS